MARDRIIETDGNTVVVERRRGSLLLRLLVLLVVVVVVVVVAVLVFGGGNDKAAAKDISISQCAADPGGGKPTASGTIVNHSSKASAYVLRIRFKDGSGNAVAEGVTNVNRVESGATATWDLTGTADAKGTLTCDLKSVQRNRVPSA